MTREELLKQAREMLICVQSWTPDARLIGNVRADTIAEICQELISADRLVVVLIHHNVDGGYQGTRLFRSYTAADGWLEREGYRRDEPNPSTWMKPVGAEWTDRHYVDCPEAFEMEVAEVYEQEVETP